MLIKPYALIFTGFLTSGTFIACSAESWFTCWLGLEINLIRLIPLLLIKLSPISTEAAIKYFLAQAIASILIMFAALSNNIMFSEIFIIEANYLIFLALSIKAGIAPLHFWFPQVIKNREWAQCALIISWQKIAPFVLLSSFLSSNIFFIITLFRVATGALGGLNQSNIKIILTYSSIIHSGWMLTVIQFSTSYWLIYFFIYVFISITLISCFWGSNIQSSSQINSSNWNTTTKSNFYLSLVSLGGLPPFLGFRAKISALCLIIYNTNLILIFIIIISSLVSLFYYIQLIYNLIMNSTEKNKILSNINNNLNNKILFSVSLLGNVLIPIILSLT